MTQDIAGDKLVAALAKIMGESERIPKRGQIRSMGGGPSYNFARDPDILPSTESGPASECAPTRP